MKKLNKKGFTIVELVIVIAVIAVLAAVLIPTFSGVVNRANESAAMQQAEIAYKNLLATYAGVEEDNPLGSGTTTNWNFYIHVGKYYFEVEEGQFQTTTLTEDDMKEITGTGITIYTLTAQSETLATTDNGDLVTEDKPAKE